MPLRIIWPSFSQCVPAAPLFPDHDLFDDFVSVLNRADELILMPVYPAGESPIVGAESKDLAQSVRRLGRRPYVEGEDQVIERVGALVQPNDVVLVQGAGSIGRLPSQIVVCLEAVMNWVSERIALLYSGFGSEADVSRDGKEAGSRNANWVSHQLSSISKMDSLNR